MPTRLPNNQLWKDTTKRFVGFMDIMGFKEMVTRHSHSQVKKILLQMSQLKDILQLTALGSASPELEKHDQRVRSVIFSDSILFVTKSDSLGDLCILLDVVSTFQSAGLQRGTPTKGAIAVGTLTADFANSLFFGQPLIDAYLLQNDLYYYGIVLDNSVESLFIDPPRASGATMVELAERLVRCPTAFKSGKIQHYNVSIRNVDPKHIDRLYGTVSGSVRKYVDNTVEFLK